MLQKLLAHASTDLGSAILFLQSLILLPDAIFFQRALRQLQVFLFRLDEPLALQDRRLDDVAFAVNTLLEPTI